MEIRVACHAGYRGEKTPRRLMFGGRNIDIVDVVDLWHGVDHRYVKVLGADRATYIIRQDIPTQTWELTMFQRPPAYGA